MLVAYLDLLFNSPSFSKFSQVMMVSPGSPFLGGTENLWSLASEGLVYGGP